jgi:carboxypeptidase family protein/TonB-dependent receptor-like protein
MGTAFWTLPKPVLRLLGSPLLIVGSLAGTAPAFPDSELYAQGVTTVGIRGTVRMADGGDPEGVQVVVRSTATGFVIETEVRRGSFLVQGLEAGGPYSITVRRIGATARRWDGVFLTLGEPLVLNVILEPAAIQVDSVVVVAANQSPLSCCHGGTATTLSDSLLHRLPSLNRDVYDFLRLVPQLSTRIGLSTSTGLARGISGGGVDFRLNDFLANGVSERSLGGSQPPEFAGGKSLPFEAVREYQVLLAPFDVRYGNFAGAMVNAVTRSGTNGFQASGFGYGRSDALARGGDLAVSPYEQWQYGASLSGPIHRDRAQFLFASEFDRVSSPMVGPFVGQTTGASPPVPVSNADLARLESILQQYGLKSGSGGPLPNRHRLRNLYGRLDAALPKWNSRAVLWVNDSDAWDEAFDRADSPEFFALSSNATEQSLGTRTIALQLYSTMRRPGGGHNELSLSRRTISLQSTPDVRQPIVQVVVPATTEGVTTVVTGTPTEAQGQGIKSWDLNLRDDLTLPLGASHVASVGLEVERFHLETSSLEDTFGTWTFLSLDSLEAGQAERFELGRDFGSAGVPISGGQLAAYVGDHWRIGERLSLTLGLRADRLTVSGRAPYNPTVDSVFSRRTDQLPSGTVHLSPRIGFTWDLHGTGRDQVRGGLGIFTGRPPLAWFHVPLQNYGVGIGTLQCGTAEDDLGPPPPFEPDPLSPPIACADGAGLSDPPPGDVELVDPDLRMARTLRGVLAYERRLPGGLLGTVEGLVTRNLSDFLFVNLNLAGPQAVDRRGRVLYGSIDSLGRSRPARVTNTYPSVVELRNVSRNHSVQVTASLTRQFEGGFAAMASYTWTQVRDVQTPLRINNRGLVNWSSRAISGRHEDLSPGISLNDVPHRVVLAGTWRAPWRKWLTEISLLYVGESGSPFTFRAGGSGGRGDLNADGGLNDPVYVPRSALDPAEILLTGLSSEPDADNSPAAQEARVLSQGLAFDRFIQSFACLHRQRGRILERNSCREPWAHSTAASLRQMIPIGNQTLQVQLDVFNLLNLLNGEWGRRRLANPVLLEHVGQTPGASGQPEPVFRFVESAADWTIDPAESAFQLQFGVRYGF